MSEVETPRLTEEAIQKIRDERDELLTALKDLVEDLEARWDMRDPRTNPGIRHYVERARATIAKVEGNVRDARVAS